MRADPVYLAGLLETILKDFMWFWSRKESVEPLKTRVEKVKSLLLTCIREGTIVQDKGAKD
ncbi:hypothetical protein DSCW_51310 [Desulfosarcina widdelii]|uniref:Uncharacterized protein n=1 Tax=Desulfosarcina widdelii TaxID=947919 RepID=A0A5K7ZHB2_9BACT|nr:hypothetical protein DSCW_51310 [Desulfosarcina widdelii]